MKLKTFKKKYKLMDEIISPESYPVLFGDTKLVCPPWLKERLLAVVIPNKGRRFKKPSKDGKMRRRHKVNYIKNTNEVKNFLVNEFIPNILTKKENKKFNSKKQFLFYIKSLGGENKKSA